MPSIGDRVYPYFKAVPRFIPRLTHRQLCSMYGEKYVSLGTIYKLYRAFQRNDFKSLTGDLNNSDHNDNYQLEESAHSFISTCLSSPTSDFNDSLDSVSEPVLNSSISVSNVPSTSFSSHELMCIDSFSDPQVKEEFDGETTITSIPFIPSSVKTEPENKPTISIKGITVKQEVDDGPSIININLLEPIVKLEELETPQCNEVPKHVQPNYPKPKSKQGIIAQSKRIQRKFPPKKTKCASRNN